MGNKFQIILLLILIIGVGIGVYLVQQRQIFRPKAAEEDTSTDEIRSLPPLPNTQTEFLGSPSDQ